MAQHTPIQLMKRPVFRKIEDGIKRDFTKQPWQYLRSSLRYLWDPQVSQALKDDDNEVVFSTDRYIGPGIVWGTTHGQFEIHFNTQTKQVVNIYLVA